MMFMSLKPAGSVGQVADGHPHCFETSKVTKGSPDVFFEGYPAARVGDPVAPHSGTCSKHGKLHSRKVDTGSPTVFANGMQVTRKGDMVKCDTGQTAALLDGRPTVLIGAKSQVPRAPTRSTVEGDAQLVAMLDINTGSTGVVGRAPSDAEPGDGPTLVARGRDYPVLSPESIRGLPAQVRLPRRVVEGTLDILKRSWDKDGLPIERGGAVARFVPSGVLSVLIGNSTSTRRSVIIDRDVPPDYQLLGGVHSHPWEGKIPVAFSGADAAVLINSRYPGEQISLVVTGEGTLYMFVRTPKTPSGVDHDKLNRVVGDKFKRLVIEEGMSVTKASEEVSKWMAKEYNLGFYIGEINSNKEAVLRRIYP
jgi:uncharacterized Zn-binding protein involved in type VI secretion